MGWVARVQAVLVGVATLAAWPCSTLTLTVCTEGLPVGGVGCLNRVDEYTPREPWRESATSRRR